MVSALVGDHRNDSRGSIRRRLIGDKVGSRAVAAGARGRRGRCRCARDPFGAASPAGGRRPAGCELLGTARCSDTPPSSPLLSPPPASRSVIRHQCIPWCRHPSPVPRIAIAPHRVEGPVVPSSALARSARGAVSLSRRPRSPAQREAPCRPPMVLNFENSCTPLRPLSQTEGRKGRDRVTIRPRATRVDQRTPGERVS